MRPRIAPAGTRRDYVFSRQATIHDVIFDLREKLRKELLTLKPEILLNRSVDEIVDDLVRRYTLTVPVLDRGGIGEMPREETQIEAPQFSQGRAFLTPGPHYVPATLFTLRVPFSGDRNLLLYPASGYTGHIPAELGENAIYLTYRGEKPDPIAINQEFDSVLKRIADNLEFVCGPA